MGRGGGRKWEREEGREGRSEKERERRGGGTMCIAMCRNCLTGG